MLLLAVETATESAGVALADEDGVLASVSVSRGRRHVEVVAPTISFLCDRVGISPAAVDAIAVDVGPGLFTGLRVGVATAQSLAFAANVGVVAVTSFDVLAAAVCASGIASPDIRVIAVVDARRGEVFSASYRIDGQTPISTGEPRIDSPDDLAKLLSGPGPTLAVGGGAIRYADIFSAVAGVEIGGATWASPPVDVLAQIGVRRALEGDLVTPSAVMPKYLREADARINWQQRQPHRAATEQVAESAPVGR